MTCEFQAMADRAVQDLLPQLAGSVSVAPSLNPVNFIASADGSCVNMGTQEHGFNNGSSLTDYADSQQVRQLNIIYALSFCLWR